MNNKLEIVWDNEGPLKDAPPSAGWAKKGGVIQGIPRGDAAPLWWEINNKDYLKGYWWPTLTPWYVVYEGEDNKGTNVRMAIHEVELWVLRANDEHLNPLNATWECIIAQPTPTWTAHYDLWIATHLANADFRVDKDGTNEYKFVSGQVIHGGTRLVDTDTTGVIAALSRVRANLVVDDPTQPIDIDEAKYLIQVGGDYYPASDIKVGDGSLAPAGYLPGIGGAGFQYLTKEPKWFSFATIAEADLGNVEKWNPWCQAGNRNYITWDEYNANPCPFGNYIPQLRLTPKELLIELINNDNHKTFTINDLEFNNLSSVVGDGYDTEVTIEHTNPGSLEVDINGAHIKYTRMDIDRLLSAAPFTINECYVYPTLDTEYITQRLADVYGMNIADGFDLVVEGTSVYIKAQASNLAYSGQSKIIKIAGLISRVPNVLLDGFEV